ncbi:MAG: PD-(D/E)XK nuclease family protein [Oscillospiraceae bacterium]|jgi:hypothetical protein|nr:PD-(D/E)XK nuclease family protein [Oscillospiraceae bacterium]
MHNNLFGYGTSELTQDAFICYLLSFAMRDYESKDPALAECARELLRKMLGEAAPQDIVVTDIMRQHEHIDVLVVVNEDTYIVIEDKTFSGTHGDQINRYCESVREEFKSERVFGVYFKIVEQAYREDGVVNITRADLLELFAKHESENAVYNSYIEYLKYIDDDVNSWRALPINEWREKTNHAYKGFFTHLVQDNIIDIDKSNDYGWHYVSNPSGGFWCLWWYSLPETLKARYPNAFQYFANLYLQIEDNRIAVKLSLTNKGSGADEAETVRRDLFEYFETIEGFTKLRFRRGAHLTVGYIE